MDKLTEQRVSTIYENKYSNKINLYQIIVASGQYLFFTQIVDTLHDQMTECRYLKPIETFDHGFRPGKWFEVDVMNCGRSALEDVNSKLGIRIIFPF